MAPAGWNEDRRIRVERIPVGHTGYVIRDGPLPPVALGDPLVLRRQELGMLLEMLKELPEHALRFAVLGLCGAGEVDVLEHELAERVGRIEDLIAHRHRRLAVRGDDHVVDHRVEALRAIATERGAYLLRDVLFAHDLGTHRVVDVVMEVRDLVGVPHDPPFGRLGDAPRCGLDPAFGGGAVLSYAVPNFLREVQSGAVLLDLLDDADALLVMAKAVGQELPEQLLTDVAEGRMPDVVAHRHRLDEVFIETKAARHRAADLRDLERVRQAGAVVVADGREEDLRLVLEPAEGLAVDDAVPIERERGSRRRRLFGASPTGVRA